MDLETPTKWDIREKNIDVNKNLIFQTLDWYCDDVNNETTDFLEYKIFAFGIDNSGSSIILRINDFFPFFFIEVDSSWDSSCVYSVKMALGFKSIKNIEFLERKRYYGFENNKIRKFLKLSFFSSKAMRYVRYRIADSEFTISGKKYTFPLYEANIDPILRFTHMRDILTAGWVIIKSGSYSTNEDSGNSGILECSWKSINNYSNELEYSNRISDVRVLYFDIEACSEDGSFPNALKKNDRITQICCIIKDTISKKISKYLFNLGTCDAIDGTTVFQYKSEKQLLIDYAQFINDTDPDIIVGYNIFGFDNGYLFERAKVLGIENSFNYQSKLAGRRSEIEKKVLNKP